MQLPFIRIQATARAAAEHTPDDRDRVVDLLRAASLVVVVLGHILMANVAWDDGVPRLGNLLADFEFLQPLTWVLQVMPLFFAAGAIANRRSYLAAASQSVSWRQWYFARVTRLVRPVVWYLAVWIPIVVALTAALGPGARPLATLSTQLLWFLAVYLAVVALTPLEIRLARSVWSVLGLLAIVVATDLARFHVAADLALVNFLVVWLLAAVLGLFVRDRVDRPVQLAIAAGAALAADVALVLFGPYPVSMVGLPDDTVSNMAPPTLLLAGHCVFLVCLTGAVWGPLTRLCHRPAVWLRTCQVGAVAMTLYLWHLTALCAVIVAQHELGWDRPPTSSPWFWPATALYLAVSLAAVVGTLALTAGFEYLRVPGLENPRPGTPAPVAVAVVGTLASSLGLLALAGTGMFGFPFSDPTTLAGLPVTSGAAIAVATAGLFALRAAGRPRS